MVARSINSGHEDVPIADLLLHPRNINDSDIGAIHESIESVGFYGAVIVQRSTRFVLAGNHRLRAAQAHGMESVPVIWVDVDDEQALRIMLADNRTAELATRDEQGLADLLQELAATPHGLAGIGYDDEDLANLLQDLANPFDPTHLNGGTGDPQPTVPEEAQAKWQVELGDVWTSGGLTLVCGDARAPSAYEQLSGDADVVWTDPPYGVDHSGGTKDPRRAAHRSGDVIQNDALNESDLARLLDDAFTSAWKKLAPGGAWYVAAPAGPPHLIFAELVSTRGWRQTLTWVKQTFVFGRSDYHYQHEPILYGWKPGAAHKWTGDRKQTSVLQHDRPTASPEHPTMKPVSLVTQCLANHATPDALVLDPFCGSGTTLLAAHGLGLRGYGIELDPKFVAVSLQRLADVGVELTRE